MKGIGSFLRSWREVQRFRKRAPSARDIVFYSEGMPYGGFFGPVVESLAHPGKRGADIAN